jgi:ABC-type multidrug transport system ATPase subunit
MSEDGILLRMADVEKQYGARKVLSVKDFALAAGDRILLMGANGSGKSTLMRIIAGVTLISRGRLKRSPEFARMVIGYVPQAGGLYGDMTLRQNLAVFSRMYGTQPGRPAEDAWFVRDTSLASFIDVQVSDMSGGIRQLAAFACVLSAGPHALLLDEPSSELDTDHARQIYESLAALREAMAFIIVSSHESRNFDFLNRKIVMAKGQIEP